MAGQTQLTPPAKQIQEFEHVRVLTGFIFHVQLDETALTKARMHFTAAERYAYVLTVCTAVVANNPGAASAVGSGVTLPALLGKALGTFSFASVDFHRNMLLNTGAPPRVCIVSGHKRSSVSCQVRQPFSLYGFEHRTVASSKFEQAVVVGTLPALLCFMCWLATPEGLAQPQSLTRRIAAL